MAKDIVKTFFALHEAVVLTGFSKHMLDYLAREEIFAPSGQTESRRGLRRRYAYADIVLLRALNAICAGKGKVRHLKDALRSFRETVGAIRPGQRLDKQLFVQGDELCTYSPSEGGRQLRSGQMTFSFVVDLGAISHELADCIEIERGKEGFKLTRAAAEAAEAERQRIWGRIRELRAQRA